MKHFSRQPRRQETLLFVDLETTGLDPEGDVIIEIGALEIEPCRERSFSCLLDNPGVTLPAEISRITGITPRMIARRGLPPPRAIESFRLFAAGAPAPGGRKRRPRCSPGFSGPPLVIGHNVDFDLDFLSRAGFTPPGGKLDTALLAALILPRERSYRLTALAVPVFPAFGAHRALADARLCRRLFLRLERIALLRTDPSLLEEMAGLVGGEEPALAKLLAGLAGRAKSRQVRGAAKRAAARRRGFRKGASGGAGRRFCPRRWEELYRRERVNLAAGSGNGLPLAYMLSLHRQSPGGAFSRKAGFLRYRYPVLNEWFRETAAGAGDCAACPGFPGCPAAARNRRNARPPNDVENGPPPVG